MDTLTYCPALVVHAELFKRILKRSFRAVVTNVDHDGTYKHQQQQKLQISRAKETAKSSQRSPFLELLSVPEVVRVDLCSVLANKVGWSCSSPEFLYALEANNERCISKGGDSLGIGQQRPPSRRFTEKEEGLHSCSHGRIVVGTERNTEDDTRDADGEGTFGHGHEMSGEELGTRSQKEEISRNLARGGTSEALSTSEDEDERFMLEALKEARKGAKIGEVPVGAVVVQLGRIIARAYNRVEAEGDATAHAEMLCIRSASKATGDWRLTDATMYVTMEPCPMCAGAMLQARMKRVVWGARNNLLGADGSWVSLFPNSNPGVKEGSQPQHPFHKTLQVRRQILSSDCSMLMRSFFRSRRKGESPAAKRKPAFLSFELWVLFRWLLGVTAPASNFLVLSEDAFLRCLSIPLKTCIVDALHRSLSARMTEVAECVTESLQRLQSAFSTNAPRGGPLSTGTTQSGTRSHTQAKYKAAIGLWTYALTLRFPSGRRCVFRQVPASLASGLFSGSLTALTLGLKPLHHL